MTKRRLESLRGEMQKCTRCSLCKMVPMPTVRDAKYANACPPVMVNHFHAYSGGGLQVMALSLIDGRIEADEDLARVAFACTTCGLCDVSCKFIMEAERQDVVLALREHIVAEGYGPKAHEAAIEQLRTTGYANGAPTEQGLLWTEGLGVKSLPRERAEVLLYTGASAYSDPKQAQTARKLAELLLEAGVDVGVLEVEPDTGIDAFWTAHREAFETHAAKVCDILDESGVERIVTVSGSHLGLLRAHYPRYARSPRGRADSQTASSAAPTGEASSHLPRPLLPRAAERTSTGLGGRGEAVARGSHVLRPTKADEQWRQRRVRSATQDSRSGSGPRARGDASDPRVLVLLRRWRRCARSAPRRRAGSSRIASRRSARRWRRNHRERLQGGVS